MPTFRHRVTGPGAAGDIWVVTLHSNSANTLAAVHTAWDTFVNTFVGTTLKTYWTPDTSTSTVQTDQLDPVTGKNVAQSVSARVIVGTGAGGAVSPRTSLCMSLRTALPTKAGRGRQYWPSPDDSHFTATGLYVTADVATITNAYGPALTTFKATAQPVIYHRSTKTFDSIIEALGNNVPATQRRRTNKVPVTYSSHAV